jgi:ribosome-binding protein aMBF1 (putative translation factor)
MSRRKNDKPPHPGMKWSEKHEMWVEADTRTSERRRTDEEILSDVEADRERIDGILRTVREAGEPSVVEEAATELARRLLEALIAARSRAGLSQTEVARRMGLPQSAIVRLEGGTHSPTLSTLARYASAIGVDLDVRQPV